MKKEIIDYLNEKAGTAYRGNTKKVSSVVDARVNEGATLEDFKKCIDNKVSSWRGGDMEQYLRPETLFGTKFWGYTNEQKTNMLEVGNRDDLIKAVLRASGMKDINTADIMIYNEVLKLVPTEQLPQFAVAVIRSNTEYMRTDQAISKAVKEFETRVLLQSMQNGKQIKDFEKFIEFIQYSFRNKPICNNIKGLYKPFVTIGMDREGNLVNKFTWKKVSSRDEQELYKWLHEHQEQIGTIEQIDYEEEQQPQLEAPQKVKIENKKVNTLVAKLAQKVKV